MIFIWVLFLYGCYYYYYFHSYMDGIFLRVTFYMGDVFTWATYPASNMLLLNCAYTQVLSQFNEFKWEIWTQAWQCGRVGCISLSQRLPKSRGLPLFQGDAEKQGWKQQRGAVRAGMFGFSFATEN